MMVRSTTRSNQRPDTLMQDRICQVDETSCNARPDHTLGQKLKSDRPLPSSALTSTADIMHEGCDFRKVPDSDIRSRGSFDHLGSVEIHREFITAAARWIFA